MIEWYFLFSILLSDPTVADGWAVQRYDHAFPTPAECETKRHETYLHYRANPVMGGGVVITGCQPRRLK